MGWTSYHATYYKNGKVDRKAECDAYFMEGLNTGWYRVIKSALVGSVYYAAVQHLKRYTDRKDENGNRMMEEVPVNERETWAAVILTKTDSRNYYNFYYKDMDETVGPCQADCPQSILKLLSPTDSQWANEWRERCRENAKKKNSPDALRNLQIGAVIRYKKADEAVIELEKHLPAYQFKRPFWYCKENNTYVPVNRISPNYEIVSR